MAANPDPAECDELIHWLGGPRPLDPSVVGSEMAFLDALSSRFNVPRGFCLTLTAGPARGDEFWSAAVERALAAWPGTVSTLRVRTSPIGPPGTAEPDIAWAPAFHHVDLNAVTEAVAECAAPLLSERHRQAWPEGVPPRLAVVVQSFQPPTVWIMTSSDGRDEDGVVRVHAGWGLRERKDTAADVFVLEAATLRIVERHTADKIWMSVPDSGGVHEIRVPAEQRAVPCLCDAQLRGAARACLEIQRRLGRPVCLELEWSGDTLSVLGVPTLR